MPADVFIAGVSRSGSTALSMLLGSHPGVAVIGESWQLAAHWKARKLCGCGAPLPECPFWRALSGRVSLEAFRPELAGRLRDAIRELVGPVVIVDTSKKAAYLRQVAPRDAVLVHLVRDPRGLILSRYRGWSKERTEGAPDAFSTARTSLDWARRNAIAHRFISKRGGLTVRYEDFATHGQLYAERILSAAGLDSGALGKNTNVQHIAAGNPVRMSTGQPLAIQPDLEWHTRLPRNIQIISYLSAWPMSAYYGYPVTQRDQTPRTQEADSRPALS